MNRSSSARARSCGSSSEQPLSTQAELAEALRAEGIDAVQTTVSRDIAQLGLVKVRNGERPPRLRAPGAADLRRLEQLAAALRRWMRERRRPGSCS